MKISRYCIVLILSLYARGVCGQSRQGYIHAGDQSMRLHDPVSATLFYSQALEYSEDASLLQKIGAAWKARFNYSTSIDWYKKSLRENNCSHADSIAGFIALSDLLKRNNGITNALSLTALLRCMNKPDSLVKDSLLNDLLLASHILNLENEMNVEPAESVNSGFSDFAPALYGDTVLLFSSRRFPVKNKTTGYHSKIMSSAITDHHIETPDVFSSVINNSTGDNADASISQDGKLIVFSRCIEDEYHNLSCSLYESTFTNNKWNTAILLNDSINIHGYTSTQACLLTNKAAGYILYFSSNRPGGKGRMDIWQSFRNAKGNYTVPVPVNKINSTADEITPFYDLISGNLYFASDRTGTAGGYDLWIYSSQSDSVFNAGIPYNSGYDDLYYTAGVSDKRYRYLVSNRPPSMPFHGESCCYDIFSVTEKPIDSLQLLKPSLKETDSIATVINADRAADSIGKFFPLRLYFDNDFPDPGSRSTITTSNYIDLLNNYLSKENEFKRRSQSPNISLFFRDSVRPALERLEQFDELLEKVLMAGYKVSFTAHGSSSPLADNRYNLILSARRIKSLLNTWAGSKHEVIREAIRSGKLTITEDATGEQQADRKVSDSRAELSQSVFSFEASVLRRIEITAITTSRP